MTQIENNYDEESAQEKRDYRKTSSSMLKGWTHMHIQKSVDTTSLEMFCGSKQYHDVVKRLLSANGWDGADREAIERTHLDLIRILKRETGIDTAKAAELTG